MHLLCKAGHTYTFFFLKHPPKLQKNELACQSLNIKSLQTPALEAGWSMELEGTQ